MLDMIDAQRAVDLVRNTYRGRYADGLDAGAVDEIFEFLELPEFTNKFELTYNACFKAANNLTKSASAFVSSVNAFVASDYRNFRRKIYVKKDPNLLWGTLVHEYIHYLTHRYLYPTCYERGGAWPDVIEGITEYLTRSTSEDVRRIRTSYPHQFQQVDSFVGSDPSKREALLDCCFKGETWKLGSLFPTT